MSPLLPVTVGVEAVEPYVQPVIETDGVIGALLIVSLTSQLATAYSSALVGVKIMSKDVSLLATGGIVELSKTAESNDHLTVPKSLMSGLASASGEKAFASNPVNVISLSFVP